MTIVCDNPYHDAGNGVCSYCVQKRIDDAVKAERERCLKVMHEAYANHRGASVQTCTPEDAKILLANMARVLKEIEDEVRGSTEGKGT